MILGTRSSAPFICGVCGRLAGGSGYSPWDSKRTNDILWTCEKHVHLAKRVYDMKPGQLSQYENAAVTRAKEECVGDFLAEVLETMWNDGAHSLTDVDADRFEVLAGKLRSSVGVEALFEKFMTSYSAYLDKIMSGEEPPF